MTPTTLMLMAAFLPPVASAGDSLRTTVSLNGEWQTAEGTRPDKPPTGARWQPTTVPGVFRGAEGQGRWLRRRIDVPEEWRGRRLWVRYDGLRWNSAHYLNGKLVGRCFEGFTPCAFDVTDAVRPGQSNELLVSVRDWQGTFIEPMKIDKHAGWENVRDMPKDRVLSPIGGRYGEYGIWADVELLAVAPVHVRDVTIRTSVRRRELTILAEVANDGRAEAKVTLAGRVVEDGSVRLPDKSLKIPPGQTATATQTVPWSSPKLWSFETPNLYHLELELRDEARVADRLTRRFGFREFWCQGQWFHLNGDRVICRASSMWPLPAHTVAEAADRLRKLKAINVNCFRTHTQPWRQLWYDAADEVGMLMIPEGPVWNDDETYRVQDERFWNHFAADLRGMVRRMGGNPSVVAWSVENEMWGPRVRDTTPYAKRKLAELAGKIRSWDPTRPVMFESDGDPDGAADVVGIHYPHELPNVYLYPDTCYWMDEAIKPIHWFSNGQALWQWDRRKPLYIGEYLWCPSRTPATYSVMYGDRAYDDYDRYRALAIGRAWSMQTRAYRYYRVSGMCPWTCAGGSLDVDKDPMAAAQAEAMRPLAAFVREYNTRFHGGAKIKRTLHVMNDTLRSGRVSVRWRFEIDGKTVGGGEVALDMKPADLAVRTFEFATPSVTRRTEARLIVEARLSDTPDFVETIPCSVFPPLKLDPVKSGGLALVGGSEALAVRLARAGLQVRRLGSFDEVPNDVRLAIVAPGALADAQAKQVKPALRIRAPKPAEEGIERFLERGGRMLLLAQPQGHLGVGSNRFASRRSTMTFPLWESHPLLRDVRCEDLRFWAPDHIVADAHVDRSTCGGRSIVVSGSAGGIDLAALAECNVGNGLVVCSGLKLLDAPGEEPAAGVILANALTYMEAWQPTPLPVVMTPATGHEDFVAGLRRTGLRFDVAGQASSEPLASAKAVLISPSCSAEAVLPLLDRLANQGGLVWWHRPEPAPFAAVMRRLDRPYGLLEASGPVRLNREGSCLDGLAQADLYWLGEHPSKCAGWYRTPEDPSIIEYEVGVSEPLDEAKARVILPEALRAVGSPYNRPLDGGLILCTHGSVVGDVDFGQAGRAIIGIRAKGWPASGAWPCVAIRVGERLVGQIHVKTGQPRIYVRTTAVPPGRQRVEVTFLNDEQTATEDRNVWIDRLYVQPACPEPPGFEAYARPAAIVSIPIGQGRLVVDTIRWDQPDSRNTDRAAGLARDILTRLGARAGSTPVAGVEAEGLEHEQTPHNRPAGDVLVMATDGWVRAPIECEVAGRYVLSIKASGTPAGGQWPLVIAIVDGKEIGRISVQSRSARMYDLPLTLDRRSGCLELRFVNDRCIPPEDRNLYLDRIEIRREDG
ncbi:MAG: hypothetical protein JXQ73_32070 [Phycisphaerae bacterium]|nr:hypothetical protein [Phycisphaerae bacterium]